MIRYLSIIAFVILPFIGIAQKFTNEQYVAQHMVNIQCNNYLDFTEILDKVKEKQILVIGESSHGDGKTIEMKSNLLEQMLSNDNYTIIFEGMSFFDGQYLRKAFLDPNSKYRGKINAYNTWLGLWSESEQSKSIVERINNYSVEVYGMDNQPGFIDAYLMDSIERFLNVNRILYQANQIDSLRTLHKLLYQFYYDTNKFKPSYIEYYEDGVNSIGSILDSLHNCTLEREVLIMAVNNVKSFIKQYRAGIFTFEGQNTGVNIRDKQMAENVKWYLKNYPGKKIIIWTANLHAAKKICEISYGKDEDPLLYNKFHLLAEHLENMYPGEVYSLAITSSRGQTGIIYENIATQITAPTASLEFELDKKEIEYGYIDFGKLRNLDEDMIFSSILLGYYEKTGKWLQVYDGLIFIKENEKARVRK